MSFGVLIVFADGREGFVEEAGRVKRFRSSTAAERMAEFWREGLVSDEAQSVNVVGLDGVEGIA